MPVLQHCSAPPAGLRFSRAERLGHEGHDGRPCSEASTWIAAGPNLAALLRRTAAGEPAGASDLVRADVGQACTGFACACSATRARRRMSLQEVYVTVWHKARPVRSGQGQRDHLAVGAGPQQGDRPAARARRSSRDASARPKTLPTTARRRSRCSSRPRTRRASHDCLDELDERARTHDPHRLFRRRDLSRACERAKRSRCRP